jgi:hypothetical protein
MAADKPQYRSRQNMMELARLLAALAMSGFSLPALAQDIPACALTGSMTMTIGGRPALRLSDVVNCPADAYEIIKSVQIDGQPMVHLKQVTTGKTRCITLENPDVTVENKQATALGDLSCAAVK